MRGRLYYAEF